jgi:hypothetical protein
MAGVVTRRSSVTPNRLGPRSAAALAAVAVSAIAIALPSSGLRATAKSSNGSADSVKVLNGYDVSVFASATKDYFNPDSIIVSGKHVFVDYQNQTSKFGTDGKFSTVVEYTLDGDVVHTFPVKGHSDGMRMDPSTGKLWALSNEDGNPEMTVISPSNGSSTLYQFDATVHGGGFDDIAFLGGKMYMSASNPTLDGSGQNTHPAVVEVALSSDDHDVDVVRNVLMGNASATDITTSSTVTLNEVDPDSLYVTPAGDLQLDNQGGTELVFIKNPGSTTPILSRLPVGNQQDDTIFPTSHSGQLLVSDTSAGKVYSIHSEHFLTNVYYSSAPGDSGVAGFVGTMNPSTGTILPLAIGTISPHGEAFISGDGEGDS